jgi:hypothetical protein
MASCSAALRTTPGPCRWISECSAWWVEDLLVDDGACLCARRQGEGEAGG